MHFIDEAIQRYAETHTDLEPEILRQLAEETRAGVPVPEMLSGHLQGRLLALLSRLVRPRQILEVGTYTGYSAICLAEGLAKNGTLHTIDIDPGLQPIIQRYLEKAGLSEQVVLHTGDAADIIPALEGPFQLVFLDADKVRYPLYFDLVIEKVTPGGLIIADNVLWSGKVLEKEQDEDTRALAEYSRKVQADPRVSNLLLPVRDGLMIAQKT